MISHHVRSRIAGIALRVFGAVVALWLIVPILIVIPLSFTGKESFQFPPTTWSTRWYENLFSNQAWSHSLTNSLLISMIVVALSVVLGTACAIGIEHGRLPGKPLVRMLVLSPMIIPLVVVAVGIYAVFLPWQLIGTRFGFVVAHTALAVPFVVISVSTSLAGFDRRLEQAAASLGASPAATFFRVTLPLILPGIFAGAVLAFVTSFDEVVVALFLQTPDLRTVPVQMFITVERIDPTIAAASTVVLAATTVGVLLVTLLNRDFREGRPGRRKAAPIEPRA
jgi:putative spermidine/putrescine transport system permease protein